MALLYLETFDWMDIGLSAAQITTAMSRKGVTNINVTSTDATTVAGIGGKGTAIRLRERDQVLRFQLGHTNAQTDEIGAGGWFRFHNAISNGNWDDDFLGWVDTDGARYLMNLRAVNGMLAIYRSSTFIAHTSFHLEYGEWYWIEYKFVVNNTTGSYEVRVDGVSVLSATGVNTEDANGNKVGNAVQIAGAADGNDGFDCAGIIVWDDQGGDLTDFPGPCSLTSIHPDGDGDDEQWTTSSGTDSYALVNETAPHDDDSDYIEDSTSTNRTLFTYGNVSTNFTGIIGIQINTVVRETDASDFTLVNTIKSGGTLYPEAAEAIAGQTYENIFHALDLDPNTSAAWTVTNLNAVQVGVEVG